MMLLNKTMMCGGLVVLSPGSPIQVLFAILIMLFHLLFVLKLGPFKHSDEDWSSFLSTLGLCLMSLGAYSMMLDDKIGKQEMKIIGMVTTILPMLCIVCVLGIAVLIDCGLKQKLCGGEPHKKWKVLHDVVKISSIQVLPVNGEEVPVNGEEKTDSQLTSKKDASSNDTEDNKLTNENERDLKSWGQKAKITHNM